MLLLAGKLFSLLRGREFQDTERYTTSRRKK